jgi:hypothetical protein
MHDGMGYFYLNPSATTGYTVEWKGGDSSANTTPLPATVPGITMEVKLENNARKIIIRKEHTTSLSQIHLLATMDGIVDYLSNIRFNNRDSIITTIPVNDLPSGIITFTVLDNDWNPLAERVSFAMGNDIHSKIPQIVVSKKDLDKKGLNTLSLQYDDTTVTDISIAVTDGDIPAESTSNIISSLLLTGGLKGKVNNPAFYFLDTSLERQQLLDLVMLTNGWRKYQWHAIVNNEPVNFKYPRDSNYFFLEGSVDNNKRKHPEQVSFLVKNRDEFSFYTFPVSSNNAFTDSSNILFDTTHFIYHPEKGFRNLKFNYAELPGAAFTHYPFQAESPRDYHFADFSNFSFYKTTLPDVIVTTTRKTKLDSIEEKYASPAFRTSEGTTLELESPANSRAAYNFTSLAKLLTARLPGYWSDKLPVYVFVNESLSTPDAAMAIPLPDIAFVKYFPRHFVLAPGNGGGALLGSITGDKTRPPGSLAIYTKQFTGSDNGYYSSNYYRVTGYTISKEYYEPDYSDSKNYDTADERKTLYWNPSINLNGKDNKEVQVSFYNNDVARKFRIVMEGLKADGTPVHTELMVK